jgi:hypothetical protein
MTLREGFRWRLKGNELTLPAGSVVIIADEAKTHKVCYTSSIYVILEINLLKYAV